MPYSLEELKNPEMFDLSNLNLTEEKLKIRWAEDAVYYVEKKHNEGHNEMSKKILEKLKQAISFLEELDPENENLAKAKHLQSVITPLVVYYIKENGEKGMIEL